MFQTNTCTLRLTLLASFTSLCGLSYLFTCTEQNNPSPELLLMPILMWNRMSSVLFSKLSRSSMALRLRAHQTASWRRPWWVKQRIRGETSWYFPMPLQWDTTVLNQKHHSVSLAPVKVFRSQMVLRSTYPWQHMHLAKIPVIYEIKFTVLHVFHSVCSRSLLTWTEYYIELNLLNNSYNLIN